MRIDCPAKTDASGQFVATLSAPLGKKLDRPAFLAAKSFALYVFYQFGEDGTFFSDTTGEWATKTVYANNAGKPWNTDVMNLDCLLYTSAAAVNLDPAHIVLSTGAKAEAAAKHRRLGFHDSPGTPAPDYEPELISVVPPVTPPTAKARQSLNPAIKRAYPLHTLASLTLSM